MIGRWLCARGYHRARMVGWAVWCHRMKCTRCSLITHDLAAAWSDVDHTGEIEK